MSWFENYTSKSYTSSCPGPKYEQYRIQANNIMEMLRKNKHELYWSDIDNCLNGQIWCDTCNQIWILKNFDAIEKELRVQCK